MLLGTYGEKAICWWELSTPTSEGSEEKMPLREVQQQERQRKKPANFVKTEERGKAWHKQLFKKVKSY